LDKLFVTLPTVSEGVIDIIENPGTSTCNKNIATDKGWGFAFIS
jgi:hypothetical protein